MSNEVEQLKHRAKTAMQRGNADKAADALNQLTLLEADNLNYRQLAADVCKKAGRKKQAASHFWYLTKDHFKQGAIEKSLKALTEHRHLDGASDQQEERNMFEHCQTHGVPIDQSLQFLNHDDRLPYAMHAHAMFNILEADMFEKVRAACEPISVKDSACVVQEGAVADCVFIITHGELRPVVTDEYNVPHHMATFKPGSMLGEAAFLTQQHLRSASLIAVGDTQLYSLPYTILEQLSEESDHFQKIMLEQQQIHKPERLLEQTSFFCNYSPEVRREIAQQMEPVTLKSGDVLFDCNERSHLDLYVVQSGLVSMAAHKDGREKYLNTAKTGDTVGELGVPHNMRKLRAHAVADAVLMRWPEVFYRSFYMHNAAIRQELLERQENFQKKTR